MASKKFIVGRKGDICIDDESVSKRHAEIELRGNEIYMRDLDSTNGIFLVKNQRLIRFHEGYVQLNQPVLFGRKLYLISTLLEMADQVLFSIDTGK